jgi:hypothetical protein
MPEIPREVIEHRREDTHQRGVKPPDKKLINYLKLGSSGQ